MQTASIYHTDEGRQEILRLYQEKLRSLGGSLTEEEVITKAGTTHVVIAGERSQTPVVVLHGVNANAPIALEPVIGLSAQYCLYGIDINGQPNLSSETRLPLEDDSYGQWLAEVLDGLGLGNCTFIAISYGAFILQKLMSYAPERIAKAIFLVPAGLSFGNPFQAIFQVLLPLRKYLRTEREDDLLRFMEAFYTELDPFSVAYQKAILEHVIMDTRRPPLVQKSQVKKLTAPVYIIAAEQDIFFPGKKAIAKAARIFPNFKEGILLKQSRHVPAVDEYGYLQQLIGAYLKKQS